MRVVLSQFMVLVALAFFTSGPVVGKSLMVRSSVTMPPPCILDLVVHNAADAGATDRFLLGPPKETARKHGSSRPPSRSGGARTVAGAAALLEGKPVSARPGLHTNRRKEH
jgi:hypothetical protein